MANWLQNTSYAHSIQTNHTTSFINLIVSFLDQKIEMWKRRKMCTKFIKMGIINNKIPKISFYNLDHPRKLENGQYTSQIEIRAGYPRLRNNGRWTGLWYFGTPASRGNEMIPYTIISIMITISHHYIWIDSAIGWHSFKNSVSFKQDQPASERQA